MYCFCPSCRFPNACLWFFCKIIYDDDFAGKSVAPFWRELENNYYLDGYLEQHGETLFTQLQSCWAWGMENEGRNIYLKSKPHLTTILSISGYKIILWIWFTAGNDLGIKNNPYMKGKLKAWLKQVDVFSEVFGDSCTMLQFKWTHYLSHF